MCLSKYNFGLIGILVTMFVNIFMYFSAAMFVWLSQDGIPKVSSVVVLLQVLWTVTLLQSFIYVT